MNHDRVCLRDKRKGLVVLVLTLWILVLPLGYQTRADTNGDTPVIILEKKQGEEGTLQLILANAPEGVYMYDITVSVRDSRIVRIRSARGIAIAGFYFQVVKTSGDSIEFRALDLDRNSVLPGARDVILAEIDVVGLARGRTGIDVEVNKFIDHRDHRVVPRVESISLEVFTPAPQLSSIGGSVKPPQDLDGDGLYEDINGDGRLTPEDVSLFALDINSEAIQTHEESFDFNEDGKIGLEDVQALAALAEKASPMLTSLRLEQGRGETGKEVALELLLVRGARGLQTYDLVLSVSDPRVAQIKGLKSDAIDQRFFQIVHQDPGSIEFRAADFRDQIQPGTDGITLATVILTGMSKGEAKLDIKVRVMTDDEGNLIEPLVQSGGVTITVFLSPIGDSTHRPQDLDYDGLYEDVNGDGRLTFADPLLLAFNLGSEVIQGNPALFDFNGDGRVDFNDAGTLATLVEKFE